MCVFTGKLSLLTFKIITEKYILVPTTKLGIFRLVGLLFILFLLPINI